MSLIGVNVGHGERPDVRALREAGAGRCGWEFGTRTSATITTTSGR